MMVGTDGVATVGVTLTTLVTAMLGPLHPVLTTFTVTLPDHPFGHVTIPEVALMAAPVIVPVVLVILVNDHCKVPVVTVLL